MLLKLVLPSVVVHVKVKSATHEDRHFLKMERNYAGQNLWARGFFVYSGGRNSDIIRQHTQEQ
jgi:putative transposase